MTDATDRNDATLLALIAQASEAGVSLVALRAVIEEASEAGAARAVARLGLADRRAGGDIAELRQLLDAWRDARRTVRSAIVGWVVRVLGAAALLFVAAKLKLLGIKTFN